MIGEARCVRVTVVVTLIRIVRVVVVHARRPVDVAALRGAVQRELLRELLVLRRIPRHRLRKRRAVRIAPERVVELAVRRRRLEAQAVGQVPVYRRLQPPVRELLHVGREASGQRVETETVVARVGVIRRLKAPVELPAAVRNSRHGAAEYGHRDIRVPAGDASRDARRDAVGRAQLHRVLVGRPLLVHVCEVGDHVHFDGVRSKEPQRHATRLHVLAAELIDDTAAVVRLTKHAAESHAADRRMGGERGAHSVAGVKTPAVMPAPPSPSDPAPCTHS